MKHTIHHRAESRGTTYTGWLHSRHSFSFGRYHDPSRMNFGALRVLNDDVVKGGMGFGEHPHANMEIVSIPLEGDLEHRDSMGNRAVIRQGDIQVMSAGTGIMHSEANANPDQEVKFLQIWLYPNRLDVVPRYQQVTPDRSQRRNRLQRILSPDPEGEGVWIHQDAWFHMGEFDSGSKAVYEPKGKDNGVYAFVVNGVFDFEGTRLGQRDGLGVTGDGKAVFESLTDGSEILLIEVPMQGFPA